MNHLFKLNRNSSYLSTMVTYVDFFLILYLFCVFFRFLSLLKRKEKKCFHLWECCLRTGCPRALGASWPHRSSEVQGVFWSGLVLLCLEPGVSAVGFMLQRGPWQPPGRPLGLRETLPTWCRGCKVRHRSSPRFGVLLLLRFQYPFISELFKVLAFLFNFMKS